MPRLIHGLSGRNGTWRWLALTRSVEIGPIRRKRSMDVESSDMSVGFDAGRAAGRNRRVSLRLKLAEVVSGCCRMLASRN